MHMRSKSGSRWSKKTDKEIAGGQIAKEGNVVIEKCQYIVHHNLLFISLHSGPLPEKPTVSIRTGRQTNGIKYPGLTDHFYFLFTCRGWPGNPK